ncbi:TetR/AcrR family transcriptional regulator [Geodermatophilus sp. YIM 151500]|uniref:TetR/AcrR family transcriptional regulator n=1 Tax=Geodermatophilus sp. YIM 151500 TaxID=2984531 RepID=UPI0021E438F6|nr:TetR/AcrR family transcriptional regulator [Geodermatophilus sp. YIM 151500]MCV2489153.1 TetR/AcrR family transcriptional regulator [Geodermatophilus sp. YIM 151500]
MTQPRSYRMAARAEGVSRTRERILAAARDAFVDRPYDEVTLAGIAAEAGVTQQTLLNHFSSKEGLLLATTESHLRGEVERLRGPVRPGDVRAAVRGLVRQYERLGDANVRVEAVAERIPLVGQVVAAARATHRAWLEEVFAGQLPDDSRARRRVLAALYAATDVGTWKLLRRDLGHSRAETTAVLESLVRAALAPPP